MGADNPGHANLIKIRPRGDRAEISRGRTSFVSEYDGDVRKEIAIEGLYVYNTRILARYSWWMNGNKPEFSCGSRIDQFSWIGYYIQAPENWQETPARECDPLQQTVELRITRSVGEGMHEDLRLTNHTQISTTVKLELEYELEFVSQDEAEGERKQHGKLESNWSQPEPDAWEEMNDYRVEHHYSHQGNEGTAKMDRGILLRIENAASAPQHDKGRLRFEIQLPPHGEWRACISWIAYVDGQRLPLSTRCPLIVSSDWDERRRRLLDVTTCVTTPPQNHLTAEVNRILARSRLDLADLRMYDLDRPGGIAIAAGVPTYMEVFGRDLLATAWQASMLGPELLHGSLNVLAEWQSTDTNAWRDAEPGRMPHEIHLDPLSVLNFRPKSLYFGSVSSCLLYPIALAELWHWSGDLELARTYKDTAIRALQWADTYSLDSSGFYRYKTSSEQGVKNQGWKDSEDAIVYPDGSQVEAPIGTCEMQGFAYASKLSFSEVLWWMGDKDLAGQLFREAEELKARFNEKFWMEDEGYIGFGIDPKGELIRSVASDAGHCLLAGIIDESRVKRVASRMLRDDLFSGWGIRTLSSAHPAFNPFSYHRGTVWPVENAAFALAFSRYGLHGEMYQVAKAMFEIGSLFEHDRLPEVFGGHARTADAPFPGLYTRADWPQAWSASAPFCIVRALLGLYAYAPMKVLFLDPHLPEWLPEITIERMRVGQAIVSLKFFRTSDGRTDYKVVHLKGTLHVIRQPSPWSITTGWAQRVKDAVSSLLPHGKSSSA